MIRSLSLKILFNTTIGWFARDMEIDFSPPVKYRFVTNKD